MEVQNLPASVRRMMEPEPLLSALVPYLSDGHFGLGVHHPLVIFPMVDPERASLVNDTYKQKVEAVAQARRDGKHYLYVFLHERPYRVPALLDIADEIPNPQTQYWRLVRDVWTDSENIFQYRTAWEILFSSQRPGREALMEDDERAHLEQLPEILTVYRGICGNYRPQKGMSWTLDYEKAVWFSRRFSHRGPGKVLVGHARKSAAYAFIQARGESELVFPPEKVRVKRKEIVIP